VSFSFGKNLKQFYRWKKFGRKVNYDNSTIQSEVKLGEINSNSSKPKENEFDIENNQQKEEPESASESNKTAQLIIVNGNRVNEESKNDLFISNQYQRNYKNNLVSGYLFLQN
jgi:hypothetical protein